METTSKMKKRLRTEQSFMVSRDEISNSGYELSLNRYKKIEDKLEKYIPPLQITKELNQIEDEIKLLKNWRKCLNELPTKTLGDLLSDAELFTDGDWVESKDQDQNGTIRLLQLADIGENYFINKSNRFINESNFGN